MTIINSIVIRNFSVRNKVLCTDELRFIVTLIRKYGVLAEAR